MHLLVGHVGSWIIPNARPPCAAGYERGLVIASAIDQGPTPCQAARRQTG
jgi:hypothetical protein